MGDSRSMPPYSTQNKKAVDPCNIVLVPIAGMVFGLDIGNKRIKFTLHRNQHHDEPIPQKNKTPTVDVDYLNLVKKVDHILHVHGEDLIPTMETITDHTSEQGIHHTHIEIREPITRKIALSELNPQPTNDHKPDRLPDSLKPDPAPRFAVDLSPSEPAQFRFVDSFEEPTPKSTSDDPGILPKTNLGIINKLLGISDVHTQKHAMGGFRIRTNSSQKTSQHQPEQEEETTQQTQPTEKQPIQMIAEEPAEPIPQASSNEETEEETTETTKEKTTETTEEDFEKTKKKLKYAQEKMQQAQQEIHSMITRN